MSVFLSLTLTIVCLTSLSAWEVSETVNAVVGQSAELPCNITAANPDDKLVIVAWYKNGSETAFFSSRDLRKGSRAVAGGRYRLVEAEGEDRLQLQAATPGDAGLYQCVADFVHSPSRTTYVLLNIIEPPQWLWVVQENESRVASARAGVNASRRVGPYYIGDTVHLFCVAFEGKPRASLSWWSDNKLLENKTTKVSEQRVRSDVALPPLRREDHGRVVSCRARNNDLTPPLTVDIIIDMYLPPELIAVRSLGEEGGRARADDTLRLQCRVLGARPPPPVVWRLGDAQLINLEQNVTREQSQRLVVSEIQLSIDHTWDETQVTCCVRERRSANDSDLICATPLPLTVFYPPVLEVVADSELDNCTLRVIKGSNVTLNCTVLANPPAYQLIWFHEDDIMTDSGSSNDTNFDPLRKLTNVTEEEAGVYVCAAINTEGSTHSDPLVLDVVYPAYCEDDTIAEYGVGADESVNLTCNVKANPAPAQYGWAVLHQEPEPSMLGDMPESAILTDDPTFTYTRPNDTAFSTILCWGINEVVAELPAAPCGFRVTDQTAPRPPANCAAVEDNREITVTCDKGHDGGLPQKFKLIARSISSGDVLVSITNLEPKFMVLDVTHENYKFEIIASNEKGDSKVVEIDKESIIHKSEQDGQSQNTVANITTLALALCGGVLLVALAACGLVLCAHDRGSRAAVRAPDPLCAYNTEETTYNDSDDSECNIRRTESFRRAMARYPSKNFDVRRTSSFHSTRYLHDFADLEPSHKHDILRHSPSCRVHSMQNIHRRRDMDGLSDHLATHLPPEVNYVPITTNTFHTMPKKMRHKLSKEISDEASVITQTSDGFSLPPPPDEFGTYRAGTRIKDIPKPPASYTNVVRKNSSRKDSTKQQQQFNDVIISPMNTVGLPSVSGPSGAYSYQDEDGRQELLRTPGVLTTFQTYSSPKESGL